MPIRPSRTSASCGRFAGREALTTGDRPPSSRNPGLKFTARPLTYQRFRQNAVLEALWTVHESDYHHFGTRRGLRASRQTPRHHRRYGIPAGNDLLPPALRGADGERGGGGRDRYAGRGPRPQAVLRANGRREGAEGFPRRTPGYRNRLAPGRDRSVPDF